MCGCHNRTNRIGIFIIPIHTSMDRIVPMTTQYILTEWKYICTLNTSCQEAKEQLDESRVSLEEETKKLKVECEACSTSTNELNEKMKEVNSRMK